MSAADLFEDGFPHGTAAGYTDGCKSNACPGRADFGMSCKMAWTSEKSDRRYRRLADDGAPPPVIALELGHVEPEQLSTDAAAAVAAWESRAKVSPEDAAEAARVVANLPMPAKVDADLSRPARIRAWAREQGIEVSGRGAIARSVIQAFDEAHGETPAPVDSEPAQAADGIVTTPPADIHTFAEPETTEEAYIPAKPGELTVTFDVTNNLPRPDFGQAMVDVDVERARRIAVRLEQELAKTEEKLDAALEEVHTLTRALAREQQVAASAEAEASALRRSIADARARRRYGIGAWVRRVVAR